MATLTLQDWTARAAAIAPEGQAFIAGDFAPAAEGKTYVNINPATGAVLNQVADCSSSDVDRAVSTARKAFDSGVWAHQSPSDRKRVILRLADLMERDRETLALLESLDMGKPIAVSCDYEMPMLIDFVRWFAEATDKLYDEIAPTGAGTLALIRREPVGVVAAVVPWNFPLDMAIWKCIPALAAGNSVVLKPAEQSPLSALHLAGLMA